MALRNQEIAERIKGLREQRGNPPQPIVAAEIGVSLRAYQKYEAGDAIPRYHNLGRLAEYYGVTESYILDGVDNRPEVQGVPEQLETVDEKFTELVAGVRRQLHVIEARLTELDDKLDRLMHMVDQGLFTPREDGGSRDDQVGVGAVLAEAFRAHPDLARSLAQPAQAAQEPPQRSASRRSRAAS